ARFPGHLDAPQVVGEVRTDLELDLAEAGRDRLLAQPAQLLVVVPEPARRRGVRREPGRPQVRDPFRPAGLRPAQDRQRVVRGERVGQVPEVDQRHDLLRRHLREHQPQRLPRALGREVPHRVDHGRDGHVHDALLRTEPAQLRVVHQLLPEPAEVGEDALDRPADEVRPQRLDRGRLDVVAAADGEREPVPLQAVLVVGAQHHVGRGVVRVRVHRVRAVQLPGRREADVVGIEREKDAHAATNRWRAWPRPSISSSTTSPARRYGLGSGWPRATPAGVPVLMTSPGYSTTNWLRYRTSSATPNAMFLVLPSCFFSPLTHSRRPRSCGSGTSSAVTNQGPSGLNVSQFFPLSHWPSRSIWNSRSETSLTTAYPPTQASASSADSTYRAVRPMTTASSTSPPIFTT